MTSFGFSALQYGNSIHQILRMKIKLAIAIASIAVVLAACGGNSTGPTIAGPQLFASVMDPAPAASETSAVSIAGYRSDYIITVNSEVVTVTNRAVASDVQHFHGVKLLRFVDKHTSFDIDGKPGQLYRLYQAAFNRSPDLTGLGFWIDGVEKGNHAMETVAGYFLASPESIRLYGENIATDELIVAAYNNVLHRAPEAAGFDWWMAAMRNGLSKQSMLYNFSESPENKANLLPAMVNGIDFVPHSAVPMDAARITTPGSSRSSS